MIILTIARTTFGEAIRKKVLMIFFGVTVAMLPVSMLFSFFAFRQEMTTIKSFGLGMIGIAGLLIAVIMGIQLIPAEIERRTIYTILSKPVNRYEFLLGKFLGAVSTLFMTVFLMGIVFIIAVTAKMYGGEIGVRSFSEFTGGISHLIQGFAPVFGALMPGVVLIFFQLLMVVGLAMFFSTYLGAWVNFFATSGLYCIGSLSAVTASLRADQSKPVLTKIFASIVHYLVPQFGNFQVLNPIIQPNFIVKDFGRYVAENVIYAMLVCVVLMIGAILIFEKKEV
jgi:ABC-type transport system involved in multi-copper enzyme maturation permease subunit